MSLLYREMGTYRDGGMERRRTMTNDDDGGGDDSTVARAQPSPACLPVAPPPEL
jgi:hypothetical protein